MKGAMQLPNSRYLEFLGKIIRFVVRILAFLMILVIFVGVADVVREIYIKLMAAPRFFLTPNDTLSIFGAFMLVLIAIEIFINIIVYLREEIIHVRIVLATAIVAVARKVIVFDFAELDYKYVVSTAAVIIALCVGYWLTGLRSISDKSNPDDLKIKD